MGGGRRLSARNTTRATQQTWEVDIPTQIAAIDAWWLSDIKSKQIAFLEKVDQVGIGHPINSIHIASESFILNIGIGEAQPSTEL